MSILLLLVAACIVWVLIDFVVAGSGLSKELRRWLRARPGDSIEIDIPSDLAIAAANGLFGVGSEVVAGSESEWDGMRVARFAIRPEILRQPIGTRLKVTRLSSKTLALLPIRK